jgi:hypothetical protein
VCFDHDLGTDDLGNVLDTGYDVMCWAFDHGLLPRRVQIVTSNPVGRENMTRLLENGHYKTRDRINFVLENEE